MLRENALRVIQYWRNVLIESQLMLGRWINFVGFEKLFLKKEGNVSLVSFINLNFALCVSVNGADVAVSLLIKRNSHLVRRKIFNK